MAASILEFPTHAAIVSHYLSPPVPSSKSTPIVDTFESIVTAGNAVDTNVSTYVVQDLIPDKIYRLTFKLSRYVAGAWVNVLGAGNESMNPASVSGIVPLSPNSGGFWWTTDQSATRQLRFKTGKDDLSNISHQGFGGVRQGIEFNTPSATAAYNTFLGPKSFTLEGNGKPTSNPLGFRTPGIVANAHGFDGYLFIFEKDAAYVDPDTHFTNRIITPRFVGHNSLDNTKGFLRITDIHIKAGGGNLHSIAFREPMFTQIGEQFYHRTGLGLDRAKEYQAGLMLVNTTAGYIKTTDLEDGSGRVIKWFVADIPVGGIWTITLGAFLNVNAVNTQLSNATSVAVSIDSIGIAGSIEPEESFRVIITAEPV
jgi:hypothetical protein